MYNLVVVSVQNFSASNFYLGDIYYRYTYSIQNLSFLNYSIWKVLSFSFVSIFIRDLSTIKTFRALRIGIRVITLNSLKIYFFFKASIFFLVIFQMVDCILSQKILFRICPNLFYCKCKIQFMQIFLYRTYSCHPNRRPPRSFYDPRPPAN